MVFRLSKYSRSHSRASCSLRVKRLALVTSAQSMEQSKVDSARQKKYSARDLARLFTPDDRISPKQMLPDPGAWKQLGTKRSYVFHRGIRIGLSVLVPGRADGLGRF